MQKNPQTPVIMFIDRWSMETDGRGAFLKVFDTLTQQDYIIREKRSHLWDLFKESSKNEAIVAVLETYQGTQYIADAQKIADALASRAVTSMVGKMGDLQTEERNRSQSLSYAKDMAVAQIINISQLYEYADKNYRYIKGVPDEN